MKFSVSNIAWPTEKNEEILPLLKSAGISALELAPTKIWPDIYKVTQKETDDFLRKVGRHGLKVVGFHALLYGQDEISIFNRGRARERAIDYLVKLALTCSWLMGGILVFGSPKARSRGTMNVDEAEDTAASFFRDLLSHCDGLDIVFVIEALGKSESDFINSAASALQLIDKVGHPKFKGHLDAKALAEAGEIREDIFESYGPVLKHFHANDPGLAVLDEKDSIGHARIAELLKRIGYEGYISLEQRSTDNDPIGRCLNSISVMRRYYDI